MTTAITYTLINEPVSPATIEADYFAENAVYYRIAKTTAGEDVCFFNPEFAFEKQHLENAQASRLFAYLKAAETYPQQYACYQKDGWVFIKLDYAQSSRLVMHLLP